MKRINFVSRFFIVIVSVIVFLVTISSCATTKGKTGDGFKYSIKKGIVTITGYNGTERDLVIPDTIGGFPVTIIDGSVFADKNIASVIFPDTLTYIGRDSFSGQNYITEISLPADIKTIRFNAFNANNLKSIIVNQKLNLERPLELPNLFMASYLMHGQKTGVYTYQDNTWLLDGKSPPPYIENWGILSTKDSAYAENINGNAGANYYIGIFNGEKPGDVIPHDYSVYILPEGTCEIGIRVETKNISGGKKFIQNVVKGKKYVVKYGIGGSGAVLFLGSVGLGNITLTEETEE